MFQLDWRRLQGTRILRLQNMDHPSLHFTNPAQNSESAETSQCTPVRGELGTDCVQQVSSELETPDGPTTNRTQASEICTSNLTAWDSGVSGANEGRPSGSQNVGTAFQDSARMFAQIDQERTHFNPTTSDEFFSLFPNPQLANPAAQMEQERTHFNPTTSDEFFSLFPNPQLANPAAQMEQERTHFNPTTSDEFFSLFPNPQLANPAAQMEQERMYLDPTTSDESFSLFPNPQLANPAAQMEQERMYLNPTTSDEFFSLFPNPQLANPEAQIGSARCEPLYSRNVSA
ncbi:hypothetical protein PENARI_c063G01133 [Penicillium arizonense]|uniref:Uncharacterized protein n=1 Tax=Penicillium arizonense TaxID=1835702 RepID=A0A1F5L2G7_PENAI|nr:hypothetical protein PENARI_c063G01133 [Penicillium arizonense]OGE47111.1 hypothetical protein PENARI_c063G01133 [Penicillium arizonense]